MYIILIIGKETACVTIIYCSKFVSSLGVVLFLNIINLSAVDNANTLFTAAV